MSTATVTRLIAPSGPRPPSGLGRDGQRLWTELQRTYGITDSGGLLLLEAACKSYSDWLAARALVEKEGMTVPTKDGVKLHPATKVVETSHRAMLSALGRLHLDVEPLCPTPGRQPGR
jgi:phage terminase small subunit